VGCPIDPARIRIPGECTRDRSVLVGKLSEILNDKRPGRVVAAMFLDMAFGSPIYERLRALGFNNVFEVNFGLTHTPDRAKANMRAYMWGEMKDRLLIGAIESDEKMAMDMAGPGYHINRSNLLVIESKTDMQKRGQASPDDGDALALTFAQAVAPAEKEEERDEDDEFGGNGGSGGFNGPGRVDAMSPTRSGALRVLTAPISLRDAPASLKSIDSATDVGGRTPSRRILGRPTKCEITLPGFGWH
jgi:hypothetical protein